MNIEDKIFRKSVVNIDKLLRYGFKKEGNKYSYFKTILNDTFKVIVEVDSPKKVKGKVIDLSFNEEYTNFRVLNITGEFVNKIREEFEKVLMDIKKNCFSENYFVFKQTNRICDLIISKYGNKPEFLWENDAGAGVFRHSDTLKWYAIVMNISKSKIDKGNDKVEIINVKLNEERIIELQKRAGFYKAYHMNKKYWISIILDDTLDDKEIMECIAESYLLTNK